MKLQKVIWRKSATVILLAALFWFCERAAEGTLTVTSYADNLGNPFTLRSAISQAQDGETILFSDALDGYTITLLNGELKIDKNLIIIGPGNASILVVG